MKLSFIKTAVLCLIAGLSLSGCQKDEPDDKTVPVAGVSLNKTSHALTVGETFALTAAVTPNNATNKTLEWTSSSAEIASVADGTVTAVAAGEAVITVRAADGGKTASCTVTVTEVVIPAAEVRLSVSYTILAPGETFALTATVAPDDATNKTLAWTSSNAEIASVADGTVTAVAVGEAVITVSTENGKTAACMVKVVEIPVMTMTTTAGTIQIALGGRTATVDWGDGNSEAIDAGGFERWIEYTYSSSQSHTITITGSYITYFACWNNQLTSLDVSKNTELMRLRCDGNQLTALDVSKNTALTQLYCYDNQLTALDVSKNTALTALSCHNNQLTALDVSKNTALTGLGCSYNQLTALDVSKNTELTKLYCYTNKLTALDVSKNTALTGLECPNNKLTALDVSKNTALTYLHCSDNQLTALDVSKSTSLTSLYCLNNKLTALDVSKNTALTYLHCNDNQLTALDVSKNTALTELSCGGNQLTALDVSKNIALTDLSCNDNPLTALDVSKNIALTKLNCMDNQLTALDMSKNTALIQLYCGDNNLSAVALNAMFETLHSNIIPNTLKRIAIGGNPGASGCDITIAGRKGWTW
ncbi:MAG: Ig-like domain-containing protein [Prevotellaceae bacterium]|jgi:uncharacterized protein YjdB|nr:Ig-like domain-containing protein [Prevotellaceae bacterium]